MGDVSRLRLEQEQQVAIFLRFVIVGKEALLHISSSFEMARNFILLDDISTKIIRGNGETDLFQCHAILDQQSNARVEISHILLQYKILLGLG